MVTTESSVAQVKKKSKKEVKYQQHLKTQEFVIVYGTNSSGYSQVQSDFALWTQEFRIYPWAWALPEISATKYKKEHHFEPFIKSLQYFSSTVSASKPFDRAERLLSDYLVSQFRDGFVEQWVQNRNIIIGSDLFSYILDEQSGEDFVDKLTNTLPWNDERYSLLREGKVSFIILHRSDHQEHIKDLWSKSGITANETSKSQKFSSWLVNDFNFDAFDSYSLAYAAVQKGISVAFVNVGEVKGDLSHYIFCDVLMFACTKGHVAGVGSPEKEITHVIENEKFDVDAAKLNQIETVVKRHESLFERCLKNDKNFQIYPKQKFKLWKRVDTDLSDESCPESNRATKDEIRNIIA